MLTKHLALLALLVILNSSFICQASIFKVVFLNPGHPEENSTGKFWSNVSLFMNAAANDLDIELVTLYAYRNHILMKSLVEDIITHKPEYVILVNEKGIASNIIKELSVHKIPIFMLLNNLNSADLLLLSDEEKNTIKGSVTPNNYIVGQQLINGLIDIYESLPADTLKNNAKTLLALEGDFTTPASLERERGLSDALKLHKEIEVLDNTVANWSKEQAYQKVKGILHRKHIDLIWAANDAMAFGAKKAVDESNLNYPVVIGGINWDVDDVNGPINLSFGGHVTLGALALVMLKDIDNEELPFNERHKIIDIFESSLNKSFPDFVKRLHSKNLDHYDFTRFCRASKNPLSFTIDNLDKSYNKIAPQQLKENIAIKSAN